MKNVIFAVAALISLAACSKPAPSIENKATALESDLLNRAAAMDREAELSTNAAAATAINSATATYNGSVDTDAAKNGN